MKDDFDSKLSKNIMNIQIFILIINSF